MFPLNVVELTFSKRPKTAVELQNDRLMVT